MHKFKIKEMTAIYSIGYGNREWEEFRRILVDRQCQFLIDVRSSPFSKFNPSFSRDSLADLCKSDSMRYVYMGDTLGGRPDSEEHFDEHGRIDYLSLARTDNFQIGIDRLVLANSKKLVTCIMCSELKPEDCHRCKLIGATLTQHNINIIHIDEQGEEISQEEAIARIGGRNQDMFNAAELATRSRGVYKK